MEKTANYGLPKWVETDPIKMDDFNAAFGKIDETLKANADAAASKAEASTVTAIAQTIANGKICRMKYGSYTGNGTYGAANAVSIDCGFYPLLVLVMVGTRTYNWTVRGDSKFFNNSGARENTMLWGDTGVSWYYPQDDQYYPPSGNQMNEANTTYYYLVLGCSSDGE